MKKILTLAVLPLMLASCGNGSNANLPATGTTFAADVYFRVAPSYQPTDKGFLVYSPIVDIVPKDGSSTGTLEKVTYRLSNGNGEAQTFHTGNLPIQAGRKLAGISADGQNIYSPATNVDVRARTPLRVGPGFYSSYLQCLQTVNVADECAYDFTYTFKDHLGKEVKIEQKRVAAEQVANQPDGASLPIFIQVPNP